jgi:hypothetical protein
MLSISFTRSGLAVPAALVCGLRVDAMSASRRVLPSHSCFLHADCNAIGGQGGPEHPSGRAASRRQQRQHRCVAHPHLLAGFCLRFAAADRAWASARRSIRIWWS